MTDFDIAIDGGKVCRDGDDTVFLSCVDKTFAEQLQEDFIQLFHADDGLKIKPHEAFDIWLLFAINISE